MNDTFVLLGILGLTMFAGGIFSTVYCFGGWKSAPKWLVITAGVMNALCLLSLWSYCMK